MSIDSKKIVKNVFFVYSRIIIVSLFGLLATRFALQALGQSDYGLYGVVGGIVAILSIINTAMSTTTRRFLNIEAGKKDGNVNKVFNSCLVINICLAILLFILAESIGLLYVYNFLNVQPDMLSSAVIVFNISTISSAVSIIFIPFLSLLESHERFDKVAIIDILLSLIKLIAIYLLIYYTGQTLIIYAVIMCAVTLGRMILYYIYCRQYWPNLIKFHFYKDKSLYKEITVFNNYITLGASSYVARSQGSNMVVNFFFGTVVNGAMSIAYAIENYVMLIISNLTTASAPQITKSYSAGAASDSVILASKINKLSVLFMSALVFIAYVELPTYLTLWLGEIPLGALVLCQCTLISALARSLSEGLPPLIQATGKIKWFQIAGSTTQLIVIPLGWILFKVGFPPQTIIICFICTTLINFFITLFLAGKIIGKQNLIIFYQTSIKHNILIIASYIAYIVANRLLFPNIPPIFNIIISLALALIMILFVGLTPAERISVFKTISKKFTKTA